MPSDPPLPPIHRPSKKPLLHRLFGFAQPAVAGVLAGALLVGAAPAQGQTIDRPHTIEFEVIGGPGSETPYTDLLRDALSRLDDMRSSDEITLEEYQRVRTRLFETSAGALLELPRDHRGRIDLEMLLAEVDPTGKTRGEVVMQRLMNRIEQRMRVTARDMANPETRFLEGNSAYKEISGEEVRRLVTAALKDMPLEELPFGHELATLLSRLPPHANVRASMSFNEMEDQLEDAAKVWLEREVRPLIEGREIEVGAIAFAAITGARLASPELAELMDGISPRITIFRSNSDDDRFGTRARLAWRDREVLPQLDVTATAQTTVSSIDLFAELEATASVESDDHLQGAARIGGRSQGDIVWFDASATQFLDEDRQTLSLMVGGEQAGIAYATGLSAIRGDDEESGRIQLEIDLSKPIQIQNARGSVGFYATAGTDTEGENDELAGGIVLQLRW